MKQQHETEIKLAVKNPKEIRRRLAELGFRPIHARHFETNFLFDFTDQRLRQSQCLLRLRFSLGRSLLTFKGAPRQSRNYKIRREIESYVEDGHRLREILLGLGMRQVFCYQKYRTMYAPRRQDEMSEVPNLVFDETPIGNYLELEGPQRWIDGVARQLGYSRREYIIESYAALYFKRCREEKKKPGNMTFPPHTNRGWVLARVGL